MWSKLFGRHTHDSAKQIRSATRQLRLQGEPLEERRLLAIDVLGVPDWVDQGPRPILNGSATIPPNNPVTGAAQSIAVNPANSAQIYLGMVNGGIWRTNNANTANPAAMTWELLTPQAPSLAIGSIAFSPLDPAGNTLFAGTGTFSNLNNAGGPAVGVLRSTDGGATWVNFGVNPADEPRIKTVLPTSIDLDPGAGVSQMVLVAGIDGSGGLYRSNNNGQSFAILSGSNGLPSGAVTQLIVDPNNVQRFFAAVPGIGGGVFRGDFNTGTGVISWTAVNTGIPVADIGTAANIQLTVEDFGATTVLFAGLADPPAAGTIDAELTGVFCSVNGGGNWTALGTPASFNPWRSAGSGFSMVADPTDEDVVYIGGLQSPSEIFRYNPVGATWDLITGAGAQGGTAPHADTRDMVFLSNTVLLESDDGGLYFLPNPLDSTNNAWGSFIGETALGTALGGVEMHDIAWDSISNVIVGGSQDNGTEAQLTPNNLVWSRFQGGDGGDVAVDSLTLAGANRSIRYSSQQRLGSFRRQVVDSLNVAVGASVELLPAGGLAGFVGQFITPIALNAIAPPAGQSTRLVIGGGTDDVVTVGAVYEANNAGVAADAASVNWTQVPTGVGFASVSALVYGGRKGGASNPDVLYAGSDGKVFLRTTPGGTLNPTAGSFGVVRDIALDPNDWAHAFVVSDDEVWETTDAGANWANRTGNLGNGNLRTVEFVELGAVDVLLVGGAGGVFRSLSNNPGVWTELGAGMPNAVTYDLDYDASDDVLVAGTFGTGAWTVPAASTKIAQPGVMDIVGDTDFPGQDDVIRIVRNAANPSLLDVTLNGALYLPRPQLSTLNQINVHGLSGNDTLIVDSSNGLVEVPGGIRFDGGTGFDLIRLEQTGGDQQDSHVYSVGALNNSGTSVITGPSGVQQLFFENVEPLVDLVPAVNLTVNGTPESNAINYGVGSVATNGLVTVDNYESIEFSNKDTLTINAGSGNDVVNLNNVNVPTELTLIGVHGDDGDDEITTRSTAGVVLFAAGDAGNDTIDASGTASVVELEGNDGDDLLQGGTAADTLTGGEGDDTFIASAGDDTLTGGAGVDTLLVRGTAGDDEIELYQSAPGVIEVTAPVGSGSYSISDVALVQVEGLGGNDTIRVRGNASVDSANGVAMAIDAMSGNDTLIVDSSNGLVDVPGGIRFDGGTGFDLIRLEQTGGDQQDSHVYSVGALNNSGTSVITGPSGVQQLF
ncbi:MAG: hypothetical protein K1X71_12610, partial [Pirellulales bacterium]|nr:hypothetical protein [Pirellulales bacterium]